MEYIIKEEVPEMLDQCMQSNAKIVNSTVWSVLFYQTMNWFMATRRIRIMAQAGFVSVIVGAGAAWFGLYVNSGTGKTRRI